MPQPQTEFVIRPTLKFIKAAYWLGLILAAAIAGYWMMAKKRPQVPVYVPLLLPAFFHALVGGRKRPSEQSSQCIVSTVERGMTRRSIVATVAAGVSTRLRPGRRLSPIRSTPLLYLR